MCIRTKVNCAGWGRGSGSPFVAACRRPPLGSALLARIVVPGYRQLRATETEVFPRSPCARSPWSTMRVRGPDRGIRSGSHCSSWRVEGVRHVCPVRTARTRPPRTRSRGVIGVRENALSVSVARTLTVSLGGNGRGSPATARTAAASPGGRTETAPSPPGAVDVRPAEIVADHPSKRRARPRRRHRGCARARRSRRSCTAARRRDRRGRRRGERAGEAIAVLEVGVGIAERAHRDVAGDPRADAGDLEQRPTSSSTAEPASRYRPWRARSRMACARRASTPNVAGSASASALGVGKRWVTVGVGPAAGRRSGGRGARCSRGRTRSRSRAG